MGGMCSTCSDSPSMKGPRGRLINPEKNRKVGETNYSDPDEDNPTTNPSAQSFNLENMQLTDKCKYKKGLLIDGFVRNMERLWFSDYSLPKSIRDSIYNFHSKILMSLIPLQSPPENLKIIYELYHDQCRSSKHTTYYHSRKEDKEYIITAKCFTDKLAKCFTGAGKCFKYDIECNKWIHFTSYPDGLKPEEHSSTREHALIYIDNKKILMALGGSTLSYPLIPDDKIWFTKCSGGKITTEFEEFPLKLPHKAYPKCTVVFDSILIVYYKYKYSKSFMWILDCNASKCRWIKPILSETEYPKDVCSLIATKSNYLHFIDIGEGTHSKIHLSQFIPRDLYNKYAYVNCNKNEQGLCSFM